MPPITALLHCSNDALRLGRTLELLLPCSEFLIVDHHSSDRTRFIARQYGARVLEPEADPSINIPTNHWILCLHPGESMNESMQASLYEFSALPLGSVQGAAFSLFVREQAADGRWQEPPRRETRLVPRQWTQRQGALPVDDPTAPTLAGELLRFPWP